MWGSAWNSFIVVQAYSSAAELQSNTTALSRALTTVSYHIDLSNEWNAWNNFFEASFYLLYSVACAFVSATVFRRMRSLLQNILAQKLLLDDLSKENSADTERQSMDGARLIAINVAVDQRSQHIRTVLLKVAINCFVIVITAVYGCVCWSLLAAQGLLPSTPPAPCPAAASVCDNCEPQEPLSSPCCSIMSLCRPYCPSPPLSLIINPLTDLHATHQHGCC
jgi:hypothetical protein